LGHAKTTGKTKSQYLKKQRVIGRIVMARRIAEGKCGKNVVNCGGVVIWWNRRVIETGVCWTMRLIWFGIV
jgi:hypothetical protein